MHSERTHSLYSPSQAEQLIGCPGSVGLIRKLAPRSDTEDSIRGTRAHEVLEAGIINGCKNAVDAISESIHWMLEFKDEDKRAIDLALDYIWKLYEEVNAVAGDAVIYVEVPVRIEMDVAPGDADGHVDVVIYSAAAGLLHVLDYKHGVGIAKDVKGNPQLLQYGYGVVFDGRYVQNPYALKQIVLHIVQPRAFHRDGDGREWEVTLADLINYKDKLRNAILAAQAPDAPLVPAPKPDGYCFFCDARTSCPALENRALAVATGKPLNNIHDIAAHRLPDPRTLDVERLAYIRKSARVLEAWLSAVDNHILELARSGIDIPGYKLVEAKAKRKWYGEENDRVTKLAALIGCNPTDLYNCEIKSITEIEDMIVSQFKRRVGRKRRNQAAEEARQLFAYFTTKESSGTLSVVELDDPRPALNLAQRAFEGIKVLPPPTGEQR